MGSERKSSAAAGAASSEMGNQQFYNSCWSPVTPVKPIEAQTMPICEGGRVGSQLGQGTWPVTTGQIPPPGFSPLAACNNNLNQNQNHRYLDINQTYNNWDEAGNNHFGKSGLDMESLNSLPFADLLALANNMGSLDNTNLHGQTSSSNFGCFDPSFMSTIGGNTAASNGGLMNGSCDLNFPPTVTEQSSGSFFFTNLAPETPVRNININIPNITVVDNDVQGDMTRNDSGFKGDSARFVHENPNPDKGGKPPVIDLNKTPNQKPKRKKHRPKVVREGEPKRTPKTPINKPAPANKTPKTAPSRTPRKATSKTPMTAPANKTGPNQTPMTDPANKTPMTNPSTKRKYVRKTPAEKAAENASHTKRKLDFDGNYKVNVESQAQNFSTRVERSSTIDLEKETEITVEKTATGEIHLNVFSNGNKPTPRSPNGSNCSTNEDLTRGKQRMEPEGGHFPISGVAVPKSNNMTGVRYNSLHGYLGMLPMYPRDSQNNGINFPPICKRKRSEKVYGSTSSTPIINTDYCKPPHTVPFQSGFYTQKPNLYSTSSTPGINPENGIPHAVPYQSDFYTQKSNLYSPPPQFNSPSFQNLLINVQGGHPPPPPLGRRPFDHLWRMTKKRSKGPTKVRDMASLMGVSVDRLLQPSLNQVRSEHLKHHNSSHSTCMQALVAHNPLPTITKKRTRRQQTSGALSKWIELRLNRVSLMFSKLDINRENKRKNKGKNKGKKKLKYVEENALVLYQRDGTIMPYIDNTEEKPLRPKVDLDQETNRVWKLLLEDINSEGIDGTDAEKVKGWKDERTVFQGRADSFIARMHQVQGDRRFSPWKGSVVDSVVGVFLTQNVSDHLSSSAFMALAARYPLKPEEHFVETIPVVEEPEICKQDRENAPKWQEGTSSQADCTIGDHEEIHSTVPEVIVKEIFQTSDDKRQQDDDLSPQSSVVCSNNSVGSISHPAEILEPSLQVNLEADQTVMSNPCVELSQNHNTDASNIRNSSLDPAVPSINMYPQMTSPFEAVENEYLKRADIESTCHNISRKSGENCRSEPSAITEESVHLPIGEKMTPETTCEASRSSNENIQTNSSEGNLNKMHYHQYIPVWGVNRMNQTAAEQHNNLRQQTEAQSLQKEAMPVSESTSAINDSKNTGQKAVDSGFKDPGLDNVEADVKIDLEGASKAKKGRTGRAKGKKKDVDWDILRKNAHRDFGVREKSPNTMNSLDWEAVRSAPFKEVSHTIRERGMNNMLAERIQSFLNRLIDDHEKIDLEWLRDVPPDKAKEYLLSIRGLGLKSVECVRLLTLHHLAFPVDTNVGRIAVRLGWVPIRPLPETLQLHLLELYPVLETIQKYLWPRLCKLDQRTLYELHYQMITFGKVFCTKSKPNCNACPMRGDCRHFASAFASARLSLPAPEEKRLVPTTESFKAPDEAFTSAGAPDEAFQAFPSAGRLMHLPPAEEIQELHVHPQSSMCEPTVEVPTSPEPIIEVPSTPEPELQKPDDDIEDFFFEDPEEIPTIKLNIEEFAQNLQNYMQQKMEFTDDNMSKALVALTPEAASIPTPRLKNVSRLRTEHQVYELPDTHQLLEGLDKREPDDPCSYMLAIWTPGETPNSVQPPESRCNAQESGQLCNEKTCFSCNSIKEANSQTVRGTILIPCRTAMRGSFPLNGTYFQVNEVFADHASSENPIDIPRDWIWNLPRRTVYFGTSIPTIFKGQTTQSIQHCFWKGFVCVRGFERETRSPRPLIARLHFSNSKAKANGKSNDKEE